MITVYGLKNCDTCRAALMAEHPALIKRPVFETGAGGPIIVGFKDEQKDRLAGG